jgi:hypothetical protein
VKETFLILKKLLTIAPVLAQPDIEKPFDVYCDASDTGIGGVLMQDDCVIAYTSRQLRRHEEHYPTHDLELLAVVHTLKVWRYYLLGNLVHIYTDHKSLKYLFTQPDMNMRQWRWLELIKDYELEVHYYHGTNKMYQYLKKNFWWTRMKCEIANYVSECDTCRRVKADHLRPTGNLQPLSIPEWKWEDICMDFIVGLSRTSRGYNSIWVIVDRLTKSAHFIPVSTTYRANQYAKLYIQHIVRYHGIPKTIISDRGAIFVAYFWE